MKQFSIIDIRLPWGQAGSRRDRRCAEVECLCADPAAWQVTCGGPTALGGPGSLRNQLY